MIYVLGFAFNYSDWSKEDHVVLIHKLRGPAPVIGKLNGVGGRVENGEPPYRAMIREFEEETGILIHEWHRFCVLRHKWYDALIHCYKARIIGERPEVHQKTDERVGWYYVKDIGSLPIVPNLRWLVPLALDQDKLSAFIDDNTPGNT